MRSAKRDSKSCPTHFRTLNPKPRRPPHSRLFGVGRRRAIKRDPARESQVGDPAGLQAAPPGALRPSQPWSVLCLPFSMQGQIAFCIAGARGGLLISIQPLFAGSFPTGLGPQAGGGWPKTAKRSLLRCFVWQSRE